MPIIPAGQQAHPMSSLRKHFISQAVIGSLATLALLTACGPGGMANLQQDFTLAAQEQLKRTLANHYTRELGNGVNLAMIDLAQVGGYLDNPLVRILLPPPLGIALGVARDLQTNPQAAVLETLMNRTAEQIIPGAAPILQAALSQITPTEARALLNGGSTAGSDFLKAKTSAKLRETLTPQIAQKLGGNGAQEIYNNLLSGVAKTDANTAETAPTVSPKLDDYVTDKTIDGIFKNLGVHETNLRENFDAATGGLLQNTAKPTVTEPSLLESAPVAPVPVEVAPVDVAPVEVAPADAAPEKAIPEKMAPEEPTPEPERQADPADSIWM